MGEKFTIVVADRNRGVRALVARELAGLGFEIVEASDGLKVVSLVDNDPGPDLLVIDLDLPFMDGFQVMERIKDRIPSIPVIIHAYPLDLTAARGSSLPDWAAGLIEKSGRSLDSLVSTVNEVLKSHYPDRFANFKTSRSNSPKRLETW